MMLKNRRRKKKPIQPISNRFNWQNESKTEANSNGKKSLPCGVDAREKETRAKNKIK